MLKDKTQLTTVSTTTVPEEEKFVNQQTETEQKAKPPSSSSAKVVRIREDVRDLAQTETLLDSYESGDRPHTTSSSY